MTASQQVVLLGSLAAVLVLGTVAMLYGRRRDPRERERVRRRAVHLRGRLADATVTDVSGDSIFYQYTVGGVSYTASQDISDLRDHLPGEPERLIGAPASLKYSSANPANSIIVCEGWSGLRWSPLAMDTHNSPPA